MSKVDVSLDSAARAALERAVKLLRQLAEYKMEPGLDQRMLDLGERKEFLNEDEYAELSSLVDFSQKRSLEKAEARLALKELREVLPELFEQ